MIELKELRKSYTTGTFTQKALDGVSLKLRDSEFVAILGPSGSGKTTLLNVLGGLDRADSGDIVVNGTSTADYRSADWDTYRNHHIGFIFQSYNLIPHQSVLSNVELALTLAGVGSAERKERARAALERVGLGEHVDKKPSQLSGGQMQRVAIARALVNDPDIVLADEPTGALDTETGVAVMDLLAEIARDRLVVMVTHNPELAQTYATRIVRLADGRIVDDSSPYDAAEADAFPDTAEAAATARLSALSAMDVAAAGQSASESAAPSKRAGQVPQADAAEASPLAKRARMGFLTALGLSFNNLMTKKGRTFLTAFAGSIGIIGIAAILSLSNGVNNYIADTEEQALTSYPLTITKSSFDLTNLMSFGMGSDESSDDGMTNFERGVAGMQNTATDSPAVSKSESIVEVSVMTDMFAQVKNNNLASFKAFLESDSSGIGDYVHTIQYTYGITPQIYRADTSEGVVQLSPSQMTATFANGLAGSAFSIGGTGMDVFNEMLDNRELLESYMDVVAGRWPERFDECVLVLSATGRLMDYTLYSIGYYDPKVMNEMTQDALNGEEVTAPKTAQNFTVEKALGMEFSVVPSSSLYEYNAEAKLWSDISGDEAKLAEKVKDGIRLKVVGVVQPAPDVNSTAMQQGIAYTPELTERLMQVAAASEIVKQQIAHPDTDVFTGETFEELREAEGTELDFASLVDVDEDALSNAFSFDESLLDASNMEIDESALEIDPSMVEVDPNAFQIDPSVIESAFGEDAFREVMANAPQFDMESSGVADAAQLGTQQQQAVSQATDSLSADFTSWLVTNNKISVGTTPNYADLFAEYLQTPSAQAIVQPLATQMGSQAQEQVAVAMNDYMQNVYAPYLASAMQQMTAQAVELISAEMAFAMQEQMAQMTSSIGATISSAISGQLQEQMSSMQDTLENGFTFDADAFANAIQFNMSQDDLTSLLTNFMNADELTYDNNMKKLGYAKEDAPDSVSIYPVDFESKEAVLRIIDNYNEQRKAAGDDESTIQYSDFAGVLMSSVTDIIDAISMILIAFVSISLVVSSIMISIITYISVLERKKEIGILRAMGASKGNIANVFNAETIIEGLIAGVLAIAVVLAVSVPVNRFVEAGWGVPNVMTLPWSAALALIGVSVLLTFLAGLIPSQAASRRDPVEALRSE